MTMLPDHVQTLVYQLKESIGKGEVSRDQIIEALNGGEVGAVGYPAHLHLRITAQRLLYYLGGFIVLLGITIFIAQDWQNLDYFGQVAVTLIPAVAAFSLGYHFLKKTKVFDLGYVFYLIAAILFPIGISVALQHQLQNVSDPTSLMTVISLILFVLYFSTYYFIHVDIYLLFAVAAATGVFFGITQMIVPVSGSTFFQYRGLVVGISYICLGYYYQNHKGLFGNIFYFFGAAWFLGSAFSLSFSPSQFDASPVPSMIWQLIFPFLLGFFYWLSVKTQRSVILLLTTLFTFAEIMKITAERFSSSLGWPLSLILAGFGIITIGYFSFNLKKKFLRKQSVNLNDSSPANF